VELLNLFGEDAGRNVVGMAFTEVNHSFLANILGAVEAEDVRWHATVSEEELGLELILWEVFENESWSGLRDQVLKELSDNGLVILTIEAI